MFSFNIDDVDQMTGSGRIAYLTQKGGNRSQSILISGDKDQLLVLFDGAEKNGIEGFVFSGDVGV